MAHCSLPPALCSWRMYAADPTMHVLPVGRRRQAAQPRLRDRHPARTGPPTATPSTASRSRATPSPRRRKDMKSRHQGQFWIGGYEKHGDKPTGHAHVSARSRSRTRGPASSSAAGRTPTTVRRARRARTAATSSRAPAAWPRKTCAAWSSISRSTRARRSSSALVDRHTGHWGHVNFDDFRFHADEAGRAAAAGRANRLAGRPDEFKYAGLPPEKAAAAMTVPEGFTRHAVRRRAGRAPADRVLPRRPRPAVGRRGVHATRSATVDGPLCRTAKAGDRILIFEDTDGDGKFDKRTVFMEGLNLVSGIEVGFGGVWVGAAPYLLFIPTTTATTSRTASRRSCSTAGATRTRTRR